MKPLPNPASLWVIASFAAMSCSHSKANSRGGGRSEGNTTSTTSDAGNLCGTDSDGDGVIDWQNNLACTGPNDDSETVPAGQLVNGWTVFQKTSGNVIYVSSSSSSASNSNSGTDINHPVKTVAMGVSLLRSGSPDWLLLKRGDSFGENLHLGSLSGKSASEPMVVSSYGASVERPILGGPISITGGSHLAVVHLAVVQSSTSGGGGATINGTDILIEGCRLEGGQYAGIGIGADAMSTNIRARRNILYKNYGHGFYVDDVDTMLIEENVIVPPPSTIGGFIHGMYISRTGNSNFTVSGNLVQLNPDYNAGNGIMLRPGGIARGNVIVGAALTGITMGACNDQDGKPPCYGINGSVIIDGNVVMDSPGSSANGLSYDVDHSQGPAQVTGNIVLRSGALLVAGGDGAIVANNTVVGENSGFTFGLGNNMSWKDNAFLNTSTTASPAGYALAWLKCVPNQASGGCENFIALGNHFFPWSEGNTGMSFTAWVSATGETGSDAKFSVVDSSRSLAIYNGLLSGAASTNAFFDTAAGQSKYSYDSRYTAAAAISYIRAGLAIAQ
jgi:hypothetical protein